jgi:hypothetical protein
MLGKERLKEVKIMKVYNETKTAVLENYDLALGYLKSDKLFVAHHEAVEERKGEGHYETLTEYPNGGKDVEWVWDIEPQEAREAYDEYEDIQVYIPYTPEELAERELTVLRGRRASECFPVVNRGKLWYDRLTSDQEIELSDWYNAWLDVTETKTIPARPAWVDDKLEEV